MDDIETPFGKKRDVLGGAASHFSVAAQALNPVKIIGVIGKDFPPKYLKYLQSKGIDISGIEKTTGETFHWKGNYEYDMAVAHTKETKLGAFASFNPKLSDEDKQSKVLFLANIDPVLQFKVFSQMRSKPFTGLDSMNFWIESKKKDLLKTISKADALFLNDAEIRELAQEASLIKAAKIVQSKGPKYVFVKKGEHGITVVAKNFIFTTSSYPTEKVKDPTGAGDSFAGGVMSYLAHKLGSGSNLTEDVIKQAVVWGSAVASFSVEGFSTDGLDALSLAAVRKRCHIIHEITRFERHS